VICEANEPSPLRDGELDRLEEVARETYYDIHGNVLPLLLPSEVACLSTARGALTMSEIAEIRTHVTHTFRSLSLMPWGDRFRRVAIIARSHHERLNGTGYPNRLRAEEIPLQSKMLSICDIFDAMTAHDRPYRRAMPLDRALEELFTEVELQHIDSDLVEIFIEGRVWNNL
jgi:HD-GYP domain-containing protein (c-di-GMP phosphodiesterase class II)